mmetsp:Transcript_34737/g.93165  ORF Transcript_34737/g.93165 Transcript_34737/m.93165 type:complete len:160 (-) Transcript_34737:516-995(-)
MSVVCLSHKKCRVSCMSRTCFRAGTQKYDVLLSMFSSETVLFHLWHCHSACSVYTTVIWMCPQSCSHNLMSVDAFQRDPFQRRGLRLLYDRVDHGDPTAAYIHVFDMLLDCSHGEGRSTGIGHNLASTLHDGDVSHGAATRPLHASIQEEARHRIHDYG